MAVLKYKDPETGEIKKVGALSLTPEDIGAATKEEVEELKTSVSEGKALIAAAVTDRGVETATDATFATMANNIKDIKISTEGSEYEYVLLIPFTAYLDERLSTIPTAANKIMSGTIDLITNFESSIQMPASASVGVNTLKPINLTLNGDYKFMVAANQRTIIYSSENNLTKANNTYIEGALLQEWKIGEVVWATSGGKIPAYNTSFGKVANEIVAQEIMNAEIENNTQCPIFGEIESADISIDNNTLSYSISFKLWAAATYMPYKNLNFALALPCKLS